MVHSPYTRGTYVCTGSQCEKCLLIESTKAKQNNKARMLSTIFSFSFANREKGSSAPDHPCCLQSNYSLFSFLPSSSSKYSHSAPNLVFLHVPKKCCPLLPYLSYTCKPGTQVFRKHTHTIRRNPARYIRTVHVHTHIGIDRGVVNLDCPTAWVTECTDKT
jgi:hypothetical protein